jgi:glutathione S-transferase
MHQTLEFLTLSRWGQVPVMEHEGRIFVQSPAILEYLADTLGRFGTANVEATQHIREWLFWNTDRLMPPLYAWYSVELGRRNLLSLTFNPVLVAEFDRKGIAALNTLDAHLSGCWFLVGDTATIADICCYSDIAFARLSDRDFAPWPNVVAWAGRIEGLPGFAKPFELLSMKDAEIAP